ncbi:MAG: hypothetical protein Q4B15_07900 [Lachnospiraceae bacterium]|nr:hypothetical protein [Lachnospiraceae bacterium]
MRQKIPEWVKDYVKDNGRRPVDQMYEDILYLFGIEMNRATLTNMKYKYKYGTLWPVTKCAACGKKFRPTAKAQKYCSYECVRKCERSQNMALYYRRKEAGLPRYGAVELRDWRNPELAKRARLAQEYGLSYGQYVAMVENPVHVDIPAWARRRKRDARA